MMKAVDMFKSPIEALLRQYPTKPDVFKPWHEHLKTIRRGLSSGAIKVSKELSDLDIAISFVMDIAYESGYEYITTEMVCYLVKAFTDVDIDQIEEDTDNA